MLEYLRKNEANNLDHGDYDAANQVADVYEKKMKKPDGTLRSPKDAVEATRVHFWRATGIEAKLRAARAAGTAPPAKMRFGRQKPAKGRALDDDDEDEVPVRPRKSRAAATSPPVAAAPAGVFNYGAAAALASSGAAASSSSSSAAPTGVFDYGGGSVASSSSSSSSAPSDMGLQQMAAFMLVRRSAAHNMASAGARDAAADILRAKGYPSAADDLERGGMNKTLWYLENYSKLSAEAERVINAWNDDDEADRRARTEADLLQLEEQLRIARADAERERRASEAARAGTPTVLRQPEEEVGVMSEDDDDDASEADRMRQAEEEAARNAEAAAATRAAARTERRLRTEAAAAEAAAARAALGGRTRRAPKKLDDFEP
jgi:hypothetical protein